ncbi:hypothetical protein TNCV_2926191 [Trichonephila clavipes]|nr:hypothetical protein TNCV_2926191 [Trichonephila clavipes]
MKLGIKRAGALIVSQLNSGNYVVWDGLICFEYFKMVLCNRTSGAAASRIINFSRLGCEKFICIQCSSGLRLQLKELNGNSGAPDLRRVILRRLLLWEYLL